MDYLSTQLKPRDVLILGGDIFDLLIGDKTYFRQKFYAEISAIRETSARGIDIRYLEGNHDFLLSGIFTRQERVKIEPNDFSFLWEGRRVHVAHGDLINPKDYGYRLLRWVTRTYFFRLLIASLPGSWIAGIGNWSSGQSRKYSEQGRENETRWYATRDLFRNYAEARAQEGEELVLIGHSHIVDFQEIPTPRGRATYCNLGFLPEGMPFLVWATPQTLPQPGIWPRSDQSK